ncbi:MAG TPA: MXAN_5808 family serine peptidase [Haliangiales bacterium]|nr:MXAN_5808 family serine peptidase [Haliangiales bacterium]
MKATLIAGAIATALILTITRPSPQGLVPFGVGQAEVRAAPGTAAAAKAKGNYDLSALRVINWAMVKVRDSYVDPKRIDAKSMLIAALDSVQRNIAEVMVDARDDKTAVIVTVNDQSKTFPIGDVDSVWTATKRLKDIFRFIQGNVSPTADLAQIEYAALNGMLSTLDPHSNLLDPEQAREMEVQTTGKFGGIGIVIGMRRDKKTNFNRLTVISLIAGDTPANRAGLKAGDRIVKINDEPTDNLTINEAMNRLRGDPRTKVTVTVERSGAKPQAYEITRDIITNSAVTKQLLAGNVGYLRITSFSQTVASDLRRAMDELRGKGVKGWVLDLRNNPGGLLEQAVRVADVFVDNGTLVTTVGHAGRQREEKRAEGGNSDRLPLAVLVSGTSASASEIVAGALKNLDRGVIVGQQTFGKGSVQILYDYEDGSKLKLTTAQYLTPGDVSIQSVGIAPDIELQRVLIPEKIAGYKDYLRLLKPQRAYRESELDAHLVSKNVREGDKPADTVRYLPPQEPKPAATAKDDDEDEDGAEDDAAGDGTAFKEDFEITFARELVASTTSMRRKDALRDAKSFVARRKAEEEARIAGALGKLELDWTAGKPGGAHLTAQVVTDRPGNKVKAGDVVGITGTVTNTGASPAYQVHARASSDDWVFDGTELVFGKIEPGAKKSFTMYVKVPKDANSRFDEVAWDFLGGDKVDAAPTKVAIEGLQRPQFAYTYQLIDEAGNGDGMLQLGESARLHVTAKNTGKGAGLLTTAMLRNASGDGVIVNKGRFELKQINPGESKSVDFTFDVKKDFRADEVVLELSVYDTELREGVNEKLHFAVAQPSAGPQPQKGVVKIAKRDVEVREGASEQSPVVGVAKKGAVLAVTGKEGPWVRVEVEPDHPGFVPASMVAPAAGPPTPNAFVPVWRVTPPVVTLAATPLETTQDKVTISGTASDDTHLEDVFVLVSNRDAKIEAKKVFYQSNRGRKSATKMDFSAQIPVWPGSNMITVFARENNDVRTPQTVWVYKNGKNPTVAAEQQPRPTP